MNANVKWPKAIVRRLRAVIASEQLDPDVEREAQRILRDVERAMASGKPKAMKNAVARFAAFFLRNRR